MNNGDPPRSVVDAGQRAAVRRVAMRDQLYREEYMPTVPLKQAAPPAALCPVVLEAGRAARLRH